MPQFCPKHLLGQWLFDLPINKPTKTLIAYGRARSKTNRHTVSQSNGKFLESLRKESVRMGEARVIEHELVSSHVSCSTKTELYCIRYTGQL